MRKGITRLPIRFSFFAAAAVTTTLLVSSPHATGDLWVWASFLFSVEEQVFIQVTFRVPFAVPWATLSGLLTEQRKERGPRESLKENFTVSPRVMPGLSQLGDKLCYKYTLQSCFCKS